MKAIEKRKKQFRLGLLLMLGAAILAIGACDKKAVDPDPPDPPIPDCERFQRATITFENHSQHSTYDVIFDGSDYGPIGNGHSMTRTVAAGEHTLIFRYSNTHGIACSEATPNLPICANVIYWCSNDE